MNLGRAIKLARAARSLSQQEFAERLGISISYLSLLENGRRDPSLAMIRAIAENLGISEDILFLTAIDYESIRAADIDTIAALSEKLLTSVIQQTLPQRRRR